MLKNLKICKENDNIKNCNFAWISKQNGPILPLKSQMWQLMLNELSHNGDLTHINDVNLAIRHCEIHHFADDINLLNINKPILVKSVLINSLTL